MNADIATPWQALFPAPVGGERPATWRFRLVRKHGQPLVLVPTRRAVLKEALGLYPAQTSAARLARRLLGVNLRLGLTLGTEGVTLSTDRNAAFLRFLLSTDMSPDEACFALLCGNPSAPGRRFILLVFDRQGRPAKLVKVGVGATARALIQTEAVFLKSMSREQLNAPALLGEFHEGEAEALALEYAPGQSPNLNSTEPLAELLGRWIQREHTVRLGDLPTWKRLASVAQSHPQYRSLESRLAAAQCHPAVFHGDFAPWNIRVNPVTSRWVVLDWERGEQAGPPGWDWFHFVVQAEMLVRRARPGAIVARLESLLAGAAFRQYAAEAGIEDLARPLLKAYLLYSLEVLRPVEGARTLRETLEEFA